MPNIKPFRALRARDDLAHKICELPYDVVTTEEARRIARSNPVSFFHISKPEVDLPQDVDRFADDVYRKGAENFGRFLEEGLLVPDVGEYLYLYRLQVNQHSQTGIVAVASCEDYINGAIKKHEQTRPEYERDRARHIEALKAQTGPAYLFHRPVGHLQGIVDEWTRNWPDVDFITDDGVRHTVWTIGQPETIREIVRIFQRMDAVYIADGHHRTAAAVRVYREWGGAGGSGWFLGVFFPADQLKIYPYNRVVRDLNGLTQAEFFARLGYFAEVTPGVACEPVRKHQIMMYIGGKWYCLDIKPEVIQGRKPHEALDVALLQEHVLKPVLGITDPRTDPRISFIGGPASAQKVQALVDVGRYVCGFSLYPVSTSDIMAIADAGLIMPPKSTWFEPKLRDGLFIYSIE